MSSQFNFEDSVTISTFKGDEFYSMRSTDIFLSDLVNVEVQPGQTLTIGNAMISTGSPLVIKKGGPTVEIKDDEYTLNRLTGICAAYSASQSSAFSPKCAMAITLGLDVTKVGFFTIRRRLDLNILLKYSLGTHFYVL